MKEQILELRNRGLSYNKIKEVVKCAKSTISYYCNEEVKRKACERSRDNKNRSIHNRIDLFKNRKKLRNSVDAFQYRNEHSRTFGYNDIINKFGLDTVCYLTGRPINLYERTYNFDHIIPASRGGNNDLENVGIACKVANASKTDLLLQEYLDLCKEVLEYHGYIVTK